MSLAKSQLMSKTVTTDARAVTPQPDVHKLNWRVAQQSGSDIWLVKQAPGWKVKFRHRNLPACSAWLTRQGVALKDAAVPMPGGWLTVRDYFFQVGITFEEAARG